MLLFSNAGNVLNFKFMNTFAGLDKSHAHMTPGTLLNTLGNLGNLG
jgi:hypothetical protein